MSPSLPEDRRSQLDGIVQQMTQNGEPDENISAVVNDFKQKYSGPPPTPEQQFSSAQQQSQARTAANTPTFGQQVGSTAQQFAQNIWGAVKGGAETLRLAAGGAASPGEYQKAEAALVQPQVQQFKKAYQAATGTGEFRGAPAVSRVAGTVGYGAAGLLPGMGPAAARGGEKAAAKDYPGAIADVGTAAALSVAPEYIGDAASAVAGKVRQFNTPNPDTTMYQALPFRHEMPDYYEMSPIVRGDIKRAAQQSQGAPPSTTGVGGGWQPNTPATPAQLSGQAPLNDIPSVLKATQAAKAENRGVMDLHVDPYRQAGWTGAGNPIADGIIDAIPATLRARAQAGIPEAVAEVQRIIQEANVYRRPFTPDEIFGLSREFNAGLNNHFLKTADQQHALIGKGGDTASLEAAARGTRNLIRQSFGDDVSDLQRRWGYLDDVESGLRDQWKKVTKSPEETPASDLDAAMLKAGIPGKITHGNIAGAKFAWRGGKTDSLLQDTFDNTEPGWPLPTPPSSGMPGLGGMPRAAGPNRQLPPATPQVPPPSGGYVSGSGGMPPGAQQNVWQGIGAPRQLPAGQAPFTQGTSAVNPAANPPRGPTGQPYNAGLLGPGSPTQGQGVTQVPPPGAINQGTLNQIPPAPRTAAAPSDTSFVRGVQAQLPPQEPLAQRMAKQVWETVKPKTETPAKAPDLDDVIDATAQEMATPAAQQPATPPPATTEPATPKVSPSVKAKRQAPPGTVGNLDKAMGVLKEGMAKTRQAPPATTPKQTATAEAPASLPESLSDAQINEAQKVIDEFNAQTPGIFGGIKDRLENVKYYQSGAGSRFPTSAGDRADAINELMTSISPVLAKRILGAGR